MLARIVGAILANRYMCHYCSTWWDTIGEQQACVDRCYRQRYGK